MKSLWRTGAALSIGFVVLILAGFALQKVPAFGAGTDAVHTAFTTGAAGKVYAGEFVATLGYLVLAVLLPLLARLLRGDSERGAAERGASETSRWLSGAVLSTGLTYVTVTLAAAFLPESAAAYDARRGTDLAAVSVVNDIHNFANFLGTAAMGAFILVTGAAILTSRALPRWLGWLSLPAGLACLAGGVPTSSLVNTVTLVWAAWFVVLAVAMVRRSGKAPAAPAATPRVPAGVPA